jgi:hypothetical protein
MFRTPFPVLKFAKPDTTAGWYIWKGVIVTSLKIPGLADPAVSACKWVLAQGYRKLGTHSRDPEDGIDKKSTFRDYLSLLPKSLQTTSNSLFRLSS